MIHIWRTSKLSNHLHRRSHVALKKSLFPFTAALLLSLASTQVHAKGETSKIVIKGPGLTVPIVIDDPKTLSNFRVWSGPGTSSNEKESFIVNWSEGVAKEPPTGLTRYEVSFYAKFREEHLVYVVFYAYDAASNKGYVYLPGNTDEWYRLNVSTIYHAVEGHWFHASHPWEDTTRGLLRKQSKRTSNVTGS